MKTIEHDSKKWIPKYSFPDNAIWHWKEQFEREPMAAITVILLAAVAVFLPLLSARLPKLVLQALEEHWKSARFARSLVILVTVLAAANMLQSSLQAYMKRMQGPFEDVFNLRLLAKRMRVDYEMLESKKFNEDAHAVYDSLYRPNSVIRDSSVIWQKSLAAAGGLALYGMILLQQSWLLLILAVAPAIIDFFLKGRAARRDRELRPALDEASRKMRYVEEQSWDFRAGKDIRMYHLGGWLLGILSREKTVGEETAVRLENGYLTANLWDAVQCFVRDCFAYLFLIHCIVRGAMPVSDFVWYLSIVSSCQLACSALLQNGELLGRLSFDYSRLRCFLDSDDGDIFKKTDSAEKRTEVPSSVTIEMNHVSFSYPGSTEPTLKDICLSIRAGESIALVGLNGAGKSTMVKLLCGLYRPTQGTILVNGRPLSEYSREEYFSLIAAVFQNVKLLPLTIAQNVAADNGDDIDRRRVRECLSLAGLLEMTDKLPEKENTSLGYGVLDHGIDLSGGERQKLWMARALYKNAPVLILDEPTAALDPLAEQEIYASYRRMSAGKTSLFISHRLASTRFCDRILLLKDGKIAESGSHEELMHRNGEYRRLFEVQGKYYRADTKFSEPQKSGRMDGTTGAALREG